MSKIHDDDFMIRSREARHALLTVLLVIGCLGLIAHIAKGQYAMYLDNKEAIKETKK